MLVRTAAPWPEGIRNPPEMQSVGPAMTVPVMESSRTPRERDNDFLESPSTQIRVLIVTWSPTANGKLSFSRLELAAATLSCFFCARIAAFRIYKPHHSRAWHKLCTQVKSTCCLDCFPERLARAVWRLLLSASRRRWLTNVLVIHSEWTPLNL